MNNLFVNEMNNKLVNYLHHYQIEGLFVVNKHEILIFEWVMRIFILNDYEQNIIKVKNINEIDVIIILDNVNE